MIRLNGYLMFWVSLISILGLVSCQSGNYTQSKTVIESREVNLSAEIYKPVGQGPFPAVVMVHGSKNHTKDFYTEYSRYFSNNGIVAANYDKRGQGKSAGDLWTATFEDLALDVESVVNHQNPSGFKT